MPSEAFSVSVPASSANLGPGFDALAVALDMHMRAALEPAPAFSLWFEKTAEAPASPGIERAIVRAMRSVHPDLPHVRMRVSNEIPLGKGFGSSAAAAVLGIAAGLRARGQAVNLRDVARRASELEGHPENALAAVYGGTVIAASSDVETMLRFAAPSDLRAVAVIPQCQMSTHFSRTLLPERYERADVVFTAQRAALLGAALASGAWHALGEAMRDRIHQPYRAAQIPGMSAALEVRARGLVASALSGAGPSLIAFVRAGSAWEPIAERLATCFRKSGSSARALSLGFTDRGLRVRAQSMEGRRCA